MKMTLTRMLLTAGLVLGMSAGAHAALAAQNHFVVFKNNTSEDFSRTAQSAYGTGGYWSATQPNTAAAGATKSGNYISDDRTAFTYSVTWTADADGTYCTFSIYSEQNAFGNFQFYESTSKGGPRASTINCAFSAPPQPYSTYYGNVEADYNVSF